jgi:PAS domain S-box-containing protein
VEALRYGARDYVLKQNLNKLVPAIQRVIHESEIEQARIQAEKELRASEEKFKNLVEEINDVFYEANAQGKIVYGSPNLFTATGYAPQEILGKRYFHLIAPEDKRWVIDYYLTQAASGVVDTRCEFRVMRKDGTKGWVEQNTRIVRDTDGSVLKYRNVVRDITERKRAEEEITMLAHSLRSVNECVSITDMEDKILFVNESFLKTYGYSENELMGKHVDIVRSPNNPPELVKEILPATLRGGWQGELLNKRKDGSEFPIYLSTTTINDKDSKPLGLIGVAKDITERRRAEKELIAAKEKADEMNRVKNYFLSNMSHELRTPLISVLGFAELLQHELKDPEHLEFANHIMAGGQRLNNTLNSILEISKLESTQSFLELKPLNLASEIETRVKSFLPMAQSKRLFLKTELSDTRLHAHIDSELFGKALYHLVDNAVKYTKEGGIFVALNNERKQENDWAVIKVIDTGVGIQRENFEKIFDAFRQSSEGHSRSHEGTGLGLTIVKKTIEMMKGKIEIESKVGKGSVFSIWLPAIPDQSQIQQQIGKKLTTTIVKPPTSREKGLQKILVVDDNASNRLFMNHCLSSNVRIIEAEDGISGVTIASKEHFGVVLMDINLGPGISGVEAMHQMRKIPGYIRVPIIAVTAYVMQGDKERFINEGFDDYLAKPFTKDVLVSLVEKRLKKYD